MKCRTLFIILFLCLTCGCAAKAQKVAVVATSHGPLPSGTTYLLIPETVNQGKASASGPLEDCLTKLLGNLGYRHAEARADAGALITARYVVRPLPPTEDGFGPMIPFSIATGGSGGALGTGNATWSRKSGIPLPSLPKTRLYEHRLTMEAVDPSAEGSRLWTVSCVLQSRSAAPDLLPLVAAACGPYVGTTTRETEVTIREDDERVRLLRTGPIIR